MCLSFSFFPAAGAKKQAYKRNIFQVQDYYVCDTCRHPRLGKTGAQLAVDQDWLNKGALPSVPAPPPVPPGAAAAEPTPTSSGSCSSAASINPAFRKLTDLMSDLANLAKVLHSLRVKLHVASQSNSAKVFMWSSQWDVPTPSIYEEIAAASGTNYLTRWLKFIERIVV